MSALRRAVSAEAARTAGREAAARAVALPEFARAEAVALYAALPDELPTRPLFEAARGAGKTVLLPRLEAGGSLVFAAVERWEDLRPGRYGVLEPPPAGVRDWPGRAGSPEAGSPEAGSLVVVPGLAFDREGRRLGRGGGHYDRALRAAPEVLRMGLAYAFQLVDSVPHGAGDERMDVVVSEREVCRTGRRVP